MNREIKLKLYQRLSTATGVPKYIEYTDGFSISQDGQCWYDEHGTERPLGHEWVAVQFTGFPDKNGTEIYDGYILRREINKHFDNKDCRHWVVYYGTWCWMRKESLDACGFALDYPDAVSNCEIIGNIYQNPELL